MSLWPGYFFGKFENMRDPVLTEMPIIHFDPEQEPDVKAETISGTLYNYTTNVIRSANGSCALEDFPPGETVFWFFPHDEIHYVVKGKAEITYSLAGTSHTELKTMTAEPGEAYLIPHGSRLTWKVAPGDPFRHLCFVMPGVPPTSRVPSKVTKLKE
jgi:uncharacterized cupin superfamily protein